MAKPSLRDRRRQEAREALYRAQLRRDQIIDMLVRNTDRIKKLRAQLTRLDKPLLHTGPASVAEGKLLEPAWYEALAAKLDDDIPDLSGGRQ
jgi:hypothetical protein